LVFSQCKISRGPFNIRASTVLVSKCSFSSRLFTAVEVATKKRIFLNSTELKPQQLLVLFRSNKRH